MRFATTRPYNTEENEIDTVLTPEITLVQMWVESGAQVNMKYLDEMFHPHYHKCSSCADKWTFKEDRNGEKSFYMPYDLSERQSTHVQL